MPDLRQIKKDLRYAMERRRAEVYAKNPEAPAALRDQFLQNIELSPKGIVSGYLARGSEMDPAPLIEALRVRGYHIALPTVTGRNMPLVFRSYKVGDQLMPGAMNIPEPASTAPVVEPDILLVPMLAYDSRYNRLGYGGGYYDRTLTALRLRKSVLAIGIAYACQEVPDVPADATDARLDRIVTEIKAF
jgi:5-formyltetrahydrofolate cyclo-ligase